MRSPGIHLSHCGRCFRHTAFTLLEMVVVMFILSLIVGAVFGIVSAVTQLTTDISTEQRRDARFHGLVELCSRTFRSLPPNAIVRLRTKQSGGRSPSQMLLVGARPPFSNEGGRVTILETEEVPGGYLRLVLRSMSQSQAIAYEKGDPNVGVRVPLLEDIATFEWSFRNPVTAEWEPVWNALVPLDRLLDPLLSRGNPDVRAAGVQRPRLIELKMALGKEPATRHIFWVPPSEPVSGAMPAQTVPPPQNPP